MSTAALAQRLRAGAVPGLNQAERNGWNDETKAIPYREKQAATEGETPIGTERTGGTGVFVGVEVKRKESRPDQAANDAQAPEPAPAPATTTASDWRQADVAYLRHHFTCRFCCAAGHGRGDRCTTGADLWVSCEAACEADRTNHLKTQRRSAR